MTIAIAQSLLCCQLQTANQKLQQLAILNGLTGIANRRYFDLVVTSSLIENEGVALLAIESLLPNASYLDKMMSFIMPPTDRLDSQFIGRVEGGYYASPLSFKSVRAPFGAYSFRISLVFPTFAHVNVVVATPMNS